MKRPSAPVILVVAAGLAAASCAGPARSREAILSTARELIAAGGLAATSTQKVALAAGLSHGAFFVHFPRREDLLAAGGVGQGGHECAGLGVDWKSQ